MRICSHTDSHAFWSTWRLIALLVLMAFSCRIMIPAGYMPRMHTDDASLAFITLCTSEGMQSMTMDLPDSQTDANAHAADAKTLKCPYGVLAHQAWLPTGTTAAIPVPATPGIRILPTSQTLPTLPARGPPLGSRAPPTYLS